MAFISGSSGLDFNSSGLQPTLNAVNVGSGITRAAGESVRSAGSTMSSVNNAVRTGGQIVSVTSSNNEITESPHQRAKKLWDERIGSARVQAYSWRLIAFSAMGLASFGKKEARGEQNHQEVHSNLLVHDTETISGTEGFPDTYGEIKSFEKEFVKNKEKESITVTAPTSVDAVIEEENLRQEPQPRPHYSASSYSNRDDDPWHEEKMREQNAQQTITTPGDQTSCL